jgi:hypothetical protein
MNRGGNIENEACEQCIPLAIKSFLFFHSLLGSFTSAVTNVMSCKKWYDH